MTVLLWISYALIAWGLGCAALVAIVDDHHPFAYLAALLRPHGGRNAR
ncbi:hypothetical protein [Streptomyces scopuliridis]|uniref:Uncharacterized protein n=1 Tax=Streptomyces scopuliridis RB72 TaxID=1440053 RepID=A0A2T7SP08_9ACTN|nr:hypothetical protein [Streptomyces scopuliridis]PVE04638.1 hypothetical protein Y717_10610 [Streptomyces scopuliridis RB72]